MLEDLGLGQLTLLWILCAGINTLYVLRRGDTSGLAVIYLFRLAMFYWVGGVVHFIARQYGLLGIVSVRNPLYTEVGLRYSTLAVLVFAGANILTLHLLKGRRPGAEDNSKSANPTTSGSSVQPQAGGFLSGAAYFKGPLGSNFWQSPSRKRDPVSHIARVYLVIGAVMFLMRFTFILQLPTVASFLSVAPELIVVGLCLLVWQAIGHEDYFRVTVVASGIVLLPFVTSSVMGFMGLGASVALYVLIFMLLHFRSRLNAALIGVLVVYLGATLYVSYKQNRGDIRRELWAQGSVAGSVEETGSLVVNPEWFNPTNVNHLRAIDVRLNQNKIMGGAVEHTRRTGEYADGETIWAAMVALIPRAIWPSKPIRAGGHEIVEEYTGFRFAGSTSIGIGKVTEAYINFGTWGVIIIYVLFGVTIAWLDVKSGRALRQRNIRTFVQWFLPGLMFLRILGPFHQLTVRLIAAFVLVWGINSIFIER